MIIRMTVHDNDFTDIIESFAKGIWFQDTCPRTVEFGSKLFDDIQKFSSLWSEITNGSGVLSNEQKVEFLDLCMQKYRQYIKNRLDDEEDTMRYMLSHIEISLQKSITPKWENGEVVYVFVHADGACITL